MTQWLDLCTGICAKNTRCLALTSVMNINHSRWLRMRMQELIGSVMVSSLLLLTFGTLSLLLHFRHPSTSLPSKGRSNTYDKFVDRGPENTIIKFKYFIFLKVIQVSQGNIKICREDGQQTYPHWSNPRQKWRFQKGKQHFKASVMNYDLWCIPRFLNKPPQKTKDGKEARPFNPEYLCHKWSLNLKWR